MHANTAPVATDPQPWTLPPGAARVLWEMIVEAQERRAAAEHSEAA